MSKCKLIRYARITGYYQPTIQWNPGKVSELSERKHYDFKKAEKDSPNKKSIS